MSENANLQKADGIENTDGTGVEESPLDPNSSEEEKLPVTESAGEASAEEEKPDDGINEIESANAEEAENGDSKKESKEEEKDYTKLGMEELVQEMESLLKSEKIQFLKRPIETIRKTFNSIVN